MILEKFPEKGEAINSLHFADDTTVIADSIAQLNDILDLVAKWAEWFHLEIHPGKSIFYTNDPKVVTLKSAATKIYVGFSNLKTILADCMIYLTP